MLEITKKVFKVVAIPPILILAALVGLVYLAFLGIKPLVPFLTREKVKEFKDVSARVLTPNKPGLTQLEPTTPKTVIIELDEELNDNEYQGLVAPDSGGSMVVYSVAATDYLINELISQLRDKG